MKIHYWCDSGANIHSCRKGTVTLDELGISLDQWMEMTEEEQVDIIRDIALDRLDWGYSLE